jgi:hypothetical protein
VAVSHSHHRSFSSSIVAYMDAIPYPVGLGIVFLGPHTDASATSSRA